MKVFDKLIKVSKQSINEKYFTVTEEELRAKYSGNELDEALKLLPTQEELDFMTVYRSTIPQLARLQRKMSVCLEVEVLDLEEEFVRFEYGDKIFKLEEPKNAYKICTALDKSEMDAFAEMVLQGCVLIEQKNKGFIDGIFSRDAKQITDIRTKSELKVDELNLLVKIADRFFFRAFMV